MTEIPHPWDGGLECQNLFCYDGPLEHSHITNPPYVPAFDRVLIPELKQ